MANTSLYNDIYTYLGAQATLTALLDTDGIVWGQMPETLNNERRIIYKMLSDPRIDDSRQRSQLWRFWICFPETGTNPKTACLTASLKLLDALHEIKGSFGSVYIKYVYNVSNQDPFYDDTSKSWIVIQDYVLKMRNLQ